MRMPHPFGSLIAESVGQTNLQESLPLTLHFFLSFLKGTCFSRANQTTGDAPSIRQPHRRMGGTNRSPGVVAFDLALLSVIPEGNLLFPGNSTTGDAPSIRQPHRQMGGTNESQGVVAFDLALLSVIPEGNLLFPGKSNHRGCPILGAVSSRKCGTNRSPGVVASSIR
jgi:hypothetical protein